MLKNLCSSSGDVKRMSSRRMGAPWTFSAEAWPRPGCLLLRDFPRKSSMALWLSLKPLRLMTRLVDACRHVRT